MESSHVHVSNVYKINLCNEGDQQASIYMVDKRMLSLNYLSVLKLPNFRVNMARAKEYRGKKRAFLFQDTLTCS